MYWGHKLSAFTVTLIILKLTILTAKTNASDAAESASRIDYLPEKNAIWVRGYPESNPARPTDLLKANSANGCNKLTRYKNGAIRVNANFWIGDEKGIGCFFQLGSKERPEETLIINGTIWIQPPRESIVRPDGRAAIVNRLTLGIPDHPAVRARLLIECAKPRQHGVLIGLRSKDRWLHRGSLHVYNSKITAARQDLQHRIGTPRLNGWFASDVRLINAELSWFVWTQCYGLNNKNATICGTTFTHGGTAFYSNVGHAEGCVFANLQTAIFINNYNITLYDCVFKDNENNFAFNGRAGDVQLIDCNLEKPKQLLQIKRATISPIRATGLGLSIYPSVTEWRTLCITVIDEQGKPVPGAFVEVSCAEHPKATLNPAALTGTDGKTPLTPWNQRMAVIFHQRQATDNPEQLKEKYYHYRLSVKKRDFMTYDRPLTIPEKNKTLKVELKRQLTSITH